MLGHLKCHGSAVRAEGDVGDPHKLGDYSGGISLRIFPSCLYRRLARCLIKRLLKGRVLRYIGISGVIKEPSRHFGDHIGGCLGAYTVGDRGDAHTAPSGREGKSGRFYFDAVLLKDLRLAAEDHSLEREHQHLLAMFGVLHIRLEPLECGVLVDHYHLLALFHYNVGIEDLSDKAPIRALFLCSDDRDRGG